MPHLGKGGPIQFINLVMNPFTYPGRHGPMRKLRLTTLGTPSGTVATLWGGVTMVSTVAERDSVEPTWTKYTFTNPTDSRSVITCRVYLDKHPAIPPPFNRFFWQLLFDSFWDGVKICDYHIGGDDGNSIWRTQGFGYPVGPGWYNPSLSPEWISCALRVRSANWAEQPEYHPYRH